MTRPRLCFDEDVNVQIVRGLIRRQGDHEADWTNVRDAGLEGREDTEVLEWAAEHGYLVVTHDANTMIRHALERVEEGRETPGLIVIPQSLAIGRAIEDLRLILAASEGEEWSNTIAYLPL